MSTANPLGALSLVCIALALPPGAAPAAQVATRSSSTFEFVGATPCGDEDRALIVGVEPGAACHAATWRLTLPAGSGR